MTKTRHCPAPSSAGDGESAGTFQHSLAFRCRSPRGPHTRTLLRAYRSRIAAPVHAQPRSGGDKPHLAEAASARGAGSEAQPARPAPGRIWSGRVGVGVGVGPLPVTGLAFLPPCPAGPRRTCRVTGPPIGSIPATGRRRRAV